MKQHIRCPWSWNESSSVYLIFHCLLECNKSLLRKNVLKWNKNKQHHKTTKPIQNIKIKYGLLLRLCIPDIHPRPDYFQDRVQSQCRHLVIFFILQSFGFEPHCAPCEICAAEATFKRTQHQKLNFVATAIITGVAPLGLRFQVHLPCANLRLRINFKGNIGKPEHF